MQRRQYAVVGCAQLGLNKLFEFFYIRLSGLWRKRAKHDFGPATKGSTRHSREAPPHVAGPKPCFARLQPEPKSQHTYTRDIHTYKAESCPRRCSVVSQSLFALGITGNTCTECTPNQTHGAPKTVYRHITRIQHHPASPMWSRCTNRSNRGAPRRGQSIASQSACTTRSPWRTNR